MWCGRLVSGRNVRHDPARLHALSALSLPPTIAALQQFLYATNWLTPKLDGYVKAVGWRNKNALQAGIDWTDAEHAGFEEVRQLIAASVPQHFVSNDAELCVLLDVSHGGWGLIVSQVKVWKENTPVHEQDHHRLVCKGCLFKRLSLNWSIVEKEAYTLVKACKDFKYLLQRKNGLKMFTDHVSLLNIVNPSREIKRHVSNKLQR
ncbi:hypothetical protein PC121_g23517 [Phytophthora cactorum]|nr:hypothetical protein PC120_g25936 [Phytophthora cactorum]KAG3040686.1 hypothetical protein PC121_g23517 [Phytophthora cactorum]